MKTEEKYIFNAYVDVPFTIKINASGFNLTFTVYTDIFEIGPTTGNITFIPIEDQIGEHIGLIKISDGFGNEELKMLNITISKLENETIS